MAELFGNPEEGKQEESQVPPAQESSAPATEPPKAEEVNQPQAQPQQDLFADQLAGIKAEDGRQKYADVSTALASIPHAQTKIREQAELIAQLQEELNKRKGVEEMIEQLNKGQEPPATTGEAVSLDDLGSLVDQMLEQRELRTKLEANKSRTKQALIDLYGEKAGDAFKQKAQELGVTTEYLTQMAAQYPDLFLKQFSGAPTPSAQSSTGTVATTAVKPQQPELKSVMRGASTKDVVSSYRAHAKQN